MNIEDTCADAYDRGALSIIDLIKYSGSKGMKWEDVVEHLLELEKMIKDEH